MELSDRFSDAVVLSCRWHAKQQRKVSHTPYVAHLLRVAGIVLEADGSEDEAIAALLHDAIEDQGGNEARETIRERFGPEVVKIVDECSDTDQSPKPPWRERKEAFLERLPKISDSAKLITAADKLDNVRSLIDGYHERGETLWDAFGGGREGTLWYYRAVTDTLRRTLPGPLTDRLARAVARLEMLVKDSRPTSDS